MSSRAIAATPTRSHGGRFTNTVVQSFSNGGDNGLAGVMYVAVSQSVKRHVNVSTFFFFPNNQSGDRMNIEYPRFTTFR